MYCRTSGTAAYGGTTRPPHVILSARSAASLVLLPWPCGEPSVHVRVPRQERRSRPGINPGNLEPIIISLSRRVDRAPPPVARACLINIHPAPAAQVRSLDVYAQIVLIFSILIFARVGPARWDGESRGGSEDGSEVCLSPQYVKRRALELRLLLAK